MANRLVDIVRNWLNPKEEDKKPEPVAPVVPQPEPIEPGRVKALNWLKAWQLLKSTDFRVLRRAIPVWVVMLVLCVTGLITWVFAILAVISKLINIAIK
jgi:hypothetical protein